MTRRALRRLPWYRRAVSWRPEAEITGYHVASPRWTAPPLRIAILADLHAAAPWLSLRDIDGWVAAVNALTPQIVLVLGDLLPDRRMPGRPLPQAGIADALARLEAPLGAHVILGNHDWADDPTARAGLWHHAQIIDTLTEAGLPPLINAARPLDFGPEAGGAWLVGFDSQRSPRPGERRRTTGRHAPETAFAQVPADAPTILMAHEPDYFALDDPRPALQVSGHTHGGQLNLMGWRPIVPSRFGSRYAYGHHRRGAGHLVVSGGLGCTALPLRIGQPPEIVVIGLTGPEEPDPWTTPDTTLPRT